MRYITTEEDYHDVINKLSKFISDSNEDQDLIMDDIQSMMKSLDNVENFAGKIPDEKYKNLVMKNINIIRLNLMGIIDVIDDLNGINEAHI